MSIGWRVKELKERLAWLASPVDIQLEQLKDFFGFVIPDAVPRPRTQGGIALSDGLYEGFAV